MKLSRSLALIAAMAAVFAFAQDDPNPLFKGYKGKPAPKFKMTDINGKTVTNQSLRGKVVVLDFWATWCGPCKAASPTMQKLSEKYRSKGLVVIGVQTKDDAVPTSARDYAKAHHYTYMFTKNNDELTNKLGITAIPAFMIIGRDGKVAVTETGAPPFNWFESAVKPLLR